MPGGQIIGESDGYTLLTDDTYSVDDGTYSDLYDDLVVNSISGNGYLYLYDCHLIVKGDVNCGGIIVDDGSSFVCHGNAVIGYFYANYDTDNHIMIYGDLLITDYSSLGNGIIELKGDLEVTGSSMYAYSGMQVVFSGEGEQHIKFRSMHSYEIHNLVNNNSSEKGIIFDYFMPQVENYQYSEGSKLYWCGKEFLVLSFDSIEEGDEVLIDSDCILTGGYYYKNLYGKLTVNGDLYVSSGYLYINGGELNVAGGLYIANPGFDFECFEEYDNGFIGDHKEREGTVWENKKYEYSFGVLQLHNGLIHVGGDFIWASNYSNSFLDSGVLEVAGDYLVDKYRYGGGIYGYSGSKVVFCGNCLQNVGMLYDYTTNQDFENLEITNTSEEGVNFAEYGDDNLYVHRPFRRYGDELCHRRKSIPCRRGAGIFSEGY